MDDPARVSHEAWNAALDEELGGHRRFQRGLLSVLAALPELVLAGVAGAGYTPGSSAPLQ
jgi:hypothetical protein